MRGDEIEHTYTDQFNENTDNLPIMSQSAHASENNRPPVQGTRKIIPF